MAKKPLLQLQDFAGVMQPRGSVLPADAEIALGLIDVKPQVRTKIGDLTDLKSSIEEHGVIQAILVHAEADGRYRLIAGERRYRASQALERPTIPVRIKRGLSEIDIRAMQVAENAEREDLSAFDEALGVAADVDTYGVAEARRIWNRSEGWISKRMGVRKYAQPVLQLLEEGLVEDLERLQSLNALFGLSPEAGQALVQKVRRSGFLSRDEVRSKVATAKAYKAQLRAEKAAATASKLVDEEAAPVQVEPAEPETGPVPGKGGHSSGAARGKSGAGSRVLFSPQSARDAEIRADVSARRSELVRRGVELGQRCVEVQGVMRAADVPMEQGEWVLWTGFLASILPLLEGLGKPRAAAYLQKLQLQIKDTHPQAAWEAAFGANPGSPKIPDMPAGWTL